MPKYKVQVLEACSPWGLIRHLRVERDDERSGISWDELQRLKDEHLGPDVLAVEIYPPARRVVNELNMRHLWEVPQDVLPIGLK